MWEIYILTPKIGHKEKKNFENTCLEDLQSATGTDSERESRESMLSPLLDDLDINLLTVFAGVEDNVLTLKNTLYAQYKMGNFNPIVYSMGLC